MAVRIMVLVLLIALSGTYGLLGARRLDLRVEELRELRLAMKLLQEQIHYLHTPMPEALQLCAGRCRPPVQVLFRHSALVLRQRQGIELNEAWLEASERLAAASNLKAEDIGILKQMSGRMGTTGITEQVRLFEWLEGELRRQEEAAETERASNRRLWSYGGFIVGAVLALLIL
ncbi:MAG: stage III sporulation protein AB [Syntrophomonadaceae bacterium]|nr:stage III sporulation protein AB [Syntrophomonadaceae bacterium]